MEKNKYCDTFVILVLFSFCLNNVISHTIRKNALVSYSIPEKRPLKKALGYNEDTYLNFTELVTKYGYVPEEHSVTTEDGYILSVFRILSKCNNGSQKYYPVMLMHGLFDSSDGWVLPGPQGGLGYYLSNNCYDVWTPNYRGNTYSRKHVKLNPDADQKYWNYSFDEIGNYDLPAIIDYILNTTQKPKLNYIGHSQGTTVFFVMASLRPEYNDKIQLSIHLAPVAWFKYATSPLPVILASYADEIKSALYSAGYAEIFAKQQLTHNVVELLCHLDPETFCGTALQIATGYKPGSISPRTLAISYGHLLVGASTKNLVHYGQLITSKRFQRYDEGRKRNKELYGTSKPPEYNISHITSPVVLICGKNDFVSSLKDVDILKSKLPNLLEYYVVPEPTWSHNNHIWGIDAPRYVYTKVLDRLKQFNN